MSGSDVVFLLGRTDDKARNFISSRVAHFFPGSLLNETLGNSTAKTQVLLCPNSPIFDEVLIGEMIATSIETGHSYRPVDGIPGTYPLLVGPVAAASDALEFFCTTQHEYCTNFNISRPNRRRVFDALVDRIASLSKQTLLDVLQFLESDAGIDLVVAYGEDVVLEKFSHCPFCNGGSQPLYSGTNHPISGFLTKNVSVYSHCLSCSLVFLNRQMKKAELWRYYQEYSYRSPQSAGETEELYQNLSELHVSHYANYVAVKKYIEKVPAGKRIGDLGAGRGEFAVFAKSSNPSAEVFAYDWRFNEGVCSALAQRKIHAVSGDFQAVHVSDFDVLTAWEVIEHLKIADLRPFLANVRSALTEGGYFILSTPDFHNRYTRALDFWAMAPGEHITVLSRRFLEPILKDVGLTIVEELHEAVTLKRPNDWFSFGADTDVHFSSKSSSALINDFLKDDFIRERIRANARSENLGSELILVCKAS